MMERYYKLEGTTPVACTLSEWADYLNIADRKVARTEHGDVSVSTVFMGMNYAQIDDLEPLVFETVVFGGPYDMEGNQYSTWSEALAGHYAMCAKVWGQE